jgi:putative PIN family toxin of toxin-antitoxin system
VIHAVLDTNVLVSAFLIRLGPPRQILNAWQEGKFELVTSLPILQEVDEVLHRERIQRKYSLREDDIWAYLLLLTVQGIVVPPVPNVDVVSRDPADNKILSAALVGQAQFIVSGDNDLLALGAFGDTKIVTPREFLGEIAGGWQPTLPQIE